MKKWNSFIKVLLLIIESLIVFFYYHGPNTHYNLILATFVPFFVPFTGVIIIIKLYSQIINCEIIKPIWNNRFFSFRQPLLFFHFFSYVFIVFGLSTMMREIIKYQDYSQIGLFAMFFGAGILFGIKLILQFTKKI